MLIQEILFQLVNAGKATIDRRDLSNLDVKPVITCGRLLTVFDRIKIIEGLLKTRADALLKRREIGRRHNDYKICRADVAKEIFSNPAFLERILNHQANGTQNIIGGHKAVCLPERIQVADANVDQTPSTFMDHIRKTLFYKGTLGQATHRIGQRFASDTLQSISHTQAQL